MASLRYQHDASPIFFNQPLGLFIARLRRKNKKEIRTDTKRNIKQEMVKFCAYMLFCSFYLKKIFNFGLKPLLFFFFFKKVDYDI